MDQAVIELHVTSVAPRTKGAPTGCGLRIALAWSAPVVMTLLSVNQQSIVASAIVAALISTGSILMAPRNVLIALPFFALLSPVAGFLPILGSSLLLSDLLFILLAFQCAVLFASNRIRVHLASVTSLITLLAVLFFLSSIIGLQVGTLVSLKSLLYLLQLLLLYVYTTRFSQDEHSWCSILNAWIGATCLGAFLLIQAYMTGTKLSNFKYALDAQVPAPPPIIALFRADYYYTGFHYALGISIVVLLLQLVLSKSVKLFAIMALPVLLVALLLMLTKTTIISIAVAMLCVLIVLLCVRPTKTLRTVAWLVALLGIGYAFVLFAFLNRLDHIQAALWIDRAFGSSSFNTRVEVIHQALSSWLAYPLQLVVGLGPDFLDGSGDPNIVTAFKFSPITGDVEGTVDSGWVSYLIELGVLGFVSLVALTYKSIATMLTYVRRIPRSGVQDPVAFYILGGLVFVVVALFTQMLGYSKVTWLPFQLVIIGLMHKRYASDRAAK